MANHSYQDFTSFLNKVQEMVQDDFDAKHEGGNNMDVDNVESDGGEWEDTNQTLVGKGPEGEETLFMLQRRGGSMRVKPKGAGRKGAPRKPPGGGGSQGRGSKWDPTGCARCSRSSHWAKECTATLDVNGEAPREKPDKKLPKKKKGKGKGKGLHD